MTHLRKVFSLGGRRRVTVVETSAGRYMCWTGRFKYGPYYTVPHAHKDVLLSFLDDAGRAHAISSEEANVAESAIREVSSVAL